jgi:quinoprotein glucose dehydrogenase
MAIIDKVPPPRIFPVLLSLIATPLLLGGLQLIILGGSFYYLLAGMVLASCALRLWQGDPLASLLYGGFLAVTCLWSFYESGTQLWALAPRILPFSALGIWFLTPWLRNSLYQGNPPPLFESQFAKYASIGIVLIAVFVFVDGTGYEVKPLSPRSGNNIANTATDWPSYGNTLAGTRYSPLDQIDTNNVADLELAWTYRTGAGGAFKATPLQIG